MPHIKEEALRLGIKILPIFPNRQQPVDDLPHQIPQRPAEILGK